ncbi:MAG: TIGR00297 family protein [Candidatus Aenigmatarchaeota archaeon]
MIYVIIALAAITLLTYKLEILDSLGCLTAFLMGFLFWHFGGFYYIFIVVFFMGIGWFVTKYKEDYKDKILPKNDVQRRTANVIANGLSPLIFTLSGNPIAFFSAVSTALSDTMASELGVLSEDAYLLVNLKRVKPGTNGAVSIGGTIFSIIGAGMIAIPYFYIFGSIFGTIVVFISGYIGCLIDSLLGCTLERKKIVNKFHVNLIATFFGGLVSILLIYLI